MEKRKLYVENVVELYEMCFVLILSDVALNRYDFIEGMENFLTQIKKITENVMLCKKMFYNTTIL